MMLFISVLLKVVSPNGDGQNAFWPPTSRPK